MTIRSIYADRQDEDEERVIAAKSAALPRIPKELLDQFVSGPMTGEAVNAASMAIKKALIEPALGAELGHHLGYPTGTAKPESVSNQRNGSSGKTVLTKGLDDMLTIRVGNGELMYIRRDVHEGITATEGQKIRRFKAYTLAEYEKKIAAGYTRVAATGTWVKNVVTKDSYVIPSRRVLRKAEREAIEDAWTSHYERIVDAELDAQDALTA